MLEATVQQRFEAAASAVVDRLQQHLEPIFVVGAGGQPDFEGSGLLLRIADRHFVVSAAHVFAACSADIVLLPDDNSGPLTPRNEPETTRSERYKEDPVDIGYVALDPDEAARFHEHRFLTPGDLDPLDHARRRAAYVALGYPASLQRADPSEATYSMELIYYNSLEVSDRVYRAARYDRAFHVLLRFDRAHIAPVRDGAKVPSFVGMSGGGVWRVDPFKANGPSSEPKLCGLVISHPARVKKSILATRIELVLVTLRHRFPELASAIPPLPWFRVDVEDLEAGRHGSSSG